MLGCLRVRAGECQPLWCGVVLGLRLGVGGLQCLWAGKVGGVSVMSIWGVGDSGGAEGSYVSAESAGMYWEYV